MTRVQDSLVILLFQTFSTSLQEKRLLTAIPDPLVVVVLEPLLLKVATIVSAVLELKTRTASTVTVMPAVPDDNHRY